MRKRMAKGDGILPKTRRSRLRLRRHLQLDSDIIACCFKEMDSQALEQEAEAAEPAGGEEACLRKVKRGPMMCGTFFPGIDWVVQEAAGKSRRRRRKKPLGISWHRDAGAYRSDEDPSHCRPFSRQNLASPHWRKDLAYSCAKAVLRASSGSYSW